MVTQIETHKIETVDTTYGWKAECSCGTYTLGFFPSSAKAKRAMMNSSHGEFKPRAEYVEVKQDA